MVLFYIAKTSFHLLRHNNNNSSSENPRLIDNTKPQEKTGALRDKYNIAPGFLFTSNTLLGVENTGGEMELIPWRGGREIPSDHPKIF